MNRSLIASFEKEYKDLIKKYKTKLIIEKNKDEYGYYTTPKFLINGDTFDPDYILADLGQCGMGR